ncbi:hypothetical protein Sjap_008669 [Stephania japonica]|uniref:OTU domain-containing protein n=1 Tax=Stephania japonica TaxID=461633 RepID=A0AAP0JS86_9MAGN
MSRFKRRCGGESPTTPLAASEAEGQLLVSVCNTHVDEIFNVDGDGDGHCGFRVVAKSLGLSDMDGWRHVRERMAKELMTNTNFGEDIYGITNFKKLLVIIQCDKDEATMDNCWMILPDIGHVISTSLNVMLVDI